MRCGQRIDRQKPQGRRAVNQDVVVVLHHLHEALLQASLTFLQGHELNLRSRQVAVGGHDIDAIHHVWHDHLDRWQRLDQGVVDTRDTLVTIDADTARAIALGIEIDQQCAFLAAPRHAARLIAVVVLPTPPF